MGPKSRVLVAIATLWSALAMAESAAAAAPDTTDVGVHWRPGRQWMSFRIGYAKSTVTNAANGSIGGGIGYSQMLQGFKLWRFELFRHFSLGGYVHFDQLGRFGGASELEIPATVELVRHFRWTSPYLRPYFGVGGGGFYRKLYRTGSDISRMKPGVYAVFGTNVPLDDHQVLGVDMRIARVNSDNIYDNPVFGFGKRSATHLSLKLNYALTY